MTVAERPANDALALAGGERLPGRLGYVEESERAATCVIVDQSVSHVSINDPDVEILPIAEALRRYDWVQDLMFGQIDPGADEHVARVAERTEEPVGHFVRVRDGAKIARPIQLFTVLATPQARQLVHHVTVVGEGAEVDVISGSAAAEGVRRGHHVSVSESYVGAGASCRSVSIEQWGEDMEVHSYGASRLAEGARVTANEIKLSGLRSHHSRNSTALAADAVANDQAVIFAPAGTDRVIDTEIDLQGPGAHAESIARMVTAGGAITNRATLVGSAPDTKGFLGCDGLKLAEEGEILSAPGLLAHSPDAQLSHEASIGMISEEKMAYLMSTGMSEELARDLIIQGFLNLREQEIPASVRDAVAGMVEAAKSGSM